MHQQNWFKITLAIAQEAFQEIVIAELAQLNYDYFEEITGGIVAYITENNFRESQLQEIIDRYQSFCSMSIKEKALIPYQNWNAQWEQEFQPLVLDNKLVIHSSLHQVEGDFPYRIIVDPQMAFGTGHHETTYLVLEQLLRLDQSKDWDYTKAKILDFGCGTGILAILAAQMGATDIDAVDYDANACENTKENMQVNSIDHIQVFCGSTEAIPNKTYKLILANINKNILIETLPALCNHLQIGGVIMLSGILETDTPEMIDFLQPFKLSPDLIQTKNEWAVMCLQKS